MPFDNQIEIPTSFMALYVTLGHSRPNAPHQVVLERYERCEDIACLLAESAQAMAFKENLSEREVLTRCYLGLIADSSNFSARESTWVVRRLAELLDCPALDADALDACRNGYPDIQA